MVRWHYQWVVIHDFLPRIVGRTWSKEILSRTRTRRPALTYYRPKREPVHSGRVLGRRLPLRPQHVRPTYKINQTVPELPIFSQKAKPAPREDFRGFRRLPSFWTLDWTFFFDVGGGKSRQQTRKIDTKLAEGLHKLAGEKGNLASLPLRNLLRGKRLGLPSGEEVAEAVGAKKVLTDQQTGVSGPTPLWFYVLREAELQENGRRLGETGARIVAEVFIGLLERDRLSFLRKPGWKPTLPAKKKGDFTMADLLEFAVPEQTKR